MQKSGFTLAEVLITIGVIGVVAAMTIPALVTNYQKKVTVTRLKQAYAQLQQAVKLSMVDNGEFGGWDVSEAGWFDRYLKNYIKGVKDDFKDLDDVEAIPYKQISGSRETGLAIVKPGFGGTAIYTLLNGVEVLVPKDNISKYYNLASNNSIPIVIDINGHLTGPNQFGKDTFYFLLYSDDGIILPLGYRSSKECTIPNNADRNFYKTSSCYNYACNKYSRGMMCAALIMKDNWTIAPDYPW